MERNRMIQPVLIAAVVLVAAPALAQAAADPARDPKQTEVWTPVPASVATPPGKAPSDAIVLFDGKDVSAWESEQGGRVPWRLADGALTVVPGSKGIRTRQRFCDVQLHATPVDNLQLRSLAKCGTQTVFKGNVPIGLAEQRPAAFDVVAVARERPDQRNALSCPGQWQHVAGVLEHHDRAPRRLARELLMVAEIERDPKVALSFTGSKSLLGKPPLFVAVEGHATLSRDRATLQAHWVPDLERWFTQGVDTPGIVLIQVKATRIHYWAGEDEGEIRL